MDWPKSLVREIATRRCILFLGAGVSSSSRTTASGGKPKDWGEFLNAARDLIGDTKKKDEVQCFLNEKDYLLALQAVSKYVDRSDYQDFLTKNFNDPKIVPSDLHKAINQLDTRIVITTNFDNIYDKYCNSPGAAEGYKTIGYKSNSLVDEIRSDTRLIIKAHGTINEINDMIFTKAEYHLAKKNHPDFYHVLRALFITNTVLFIGCGLKDPDIMLLLEDVNTIAKSTKPHYALVKENQESEIRKQDLKESYSIQVLEYGPNYSDLIPCVQQLVELVEQERVKGST